jgi:Immunoglobulin domain
LILATCRSDSITRQAQKRFFILSSNLRTLSRSPMNSPHLSHALVLTLACTLPSHSQTIPNIAPEIVSAWKANGSDALLIFRYDGVYFQVQDDASRPGIERGTFTWDKVTSAFSATTLRDTNGESGLSHPAGTSTLSVSGNTLTYTVVGEGSFTFSRVVNTASAIVGSWFFPGDPSTVTFLADGTYFSTEEENDAPFSYDGMERGTYSWNSTTKVLTANATTDTNGETGLSSLPAGFTATIAGNTMTVSDDVGTSVLRRITQIPTPLNIAPDFEVDKFSNYRQTSTTNPALLPFPLPPEGGDFPFWGEAYIDGSVSGTGGSLTITGQAARPFVDDDGWSIANEYSSLTLLNASTAFPNGATYTFARTGGTAALTYPAGGTFPPAPKIQPIDEDDGTWSGGEYQLGPKQTLTWNPHATYNPATLVTVLSVVDLVTQEELFYETVIQGDITSYDFSGRLAPGRAYDVQLEHIKIASSTTSGTGPFSGKLGYALYNSNTRFIMVAPDESTSPPVIIEQPVSQSPSPSSAVTLTVATEANDPTETYQWYQNNQAIPGQTGNSLAIRNYSNATDGGTYNVVVTNPVDSITSAPAILGNSAATPYSTWQSSFFNPTQLANPAISGDTVDFDSDGIPNLLEYLLGGNPVLASSSLLPTITKAPGSNTLVFTYKRKIAATGVTQVIEHATSLSPPWTPAVHGAGGVTIITAAVPGDATAEQVTVTIPSTSSSRFVRLNARR